VIIGLTREFPELITSALGGYTLAIALVATRLSWKLRGPAAAVGTIVLVVGTRMRSEYWFLASDDLAHRMSMGILSVGRGVVGSAATFPVDQYHWVSPVGTALQADLGQAAILPVFTIASPIASLVMMLASFALILRTICRERPAQLAYLLSGLTLVVLVKVRVETEAVVGRLGALVTLLGLASVAQIWLINNEVRRSDVIRLVVTFVGVAAMLVLYRPDLVVFMLLSLVGLLFSIVTPEGKSRFSLLTLVSLAAVGVGLIALRFILPIVLRSGASFGFLGVRWRPPDMGWCVRGSTIRDSLCVLSFDIDLWFSILFVAVYLAWTRSAPSLLTRTTQLLLPAILSFLPFRLTLSTNFPSAIDGFVEIGLRSALVLLLVTVVDLSATRNTFTRAAVFGVAAVMAAVHLAIRSYFAEVVGTRQEGVIGRLQGIFTPLTFAWLVATLIIVVLVLVFLVSGIGQSARKLPVVLLVAFVLAGLWGEVSNRALITDVNRQLIDETLGPTDVFKVGEWLRTNTPGDALLATNYQCNPGRSDKCRSLMGHLDTNLPTATANWMLMATSGRDFLYLSQPWYNEPSFATLHAVSVRPGTHTAPDFHELEERNVSFYVALRESTAPAAWVEFVKRAAFTTENFAVIQLNP